MRSTYLQDLERWVQSEGYVKKNFGPEALKSNQESLRRAAKEAYDAGAALGEIARITRRPEAVVSKWLGLGT